MNYKVKNGDTGNWMTYHRDYDGNYSLVHPGLPRVCGLSYCKPSYVYETEVKRDSFFKPSYYFGRSLDYLFTEVETKTTKRRRDVFENRRGRLVTRRYRPTRTYKTEIFLNY